MHGLPSASGSGPFPAAPSAAPAISGSGPSGPGDAGVASGSSHTAHARAVLEPDWAFRHAEVAEGILEWARLPARRATSAPLFELSAGSPPAPSGPGGTAGRGGRGLPVLQGILSMSPLLTDGGAGAATNPVLMLIKCPTGSGPQLAELMRLFNAHDVRHMITLGPLPRGFLPEPTLFASAGSIHQSLGQSLVASSTEARPFSAGQVSTLTLINTSSPPAPTGIPASTDVSSSTTPAAAPASAHSLVVERLQVTLPTPELLEPTALLAIMQWLCMHTQPGDRVAVMAAESNDRRRHLREDPALMFIGGQLAMALALQQAPALSGQLQQAHPLLVSPSAQRTTLLAAAARALHDLNPSLVGEALHLSALLEAQQTWAGLNARTSTSPVVGQAYWIPPSGIVQGAVNGAAAARHDPTSSGDATAMPLSDQAVRN